MLAALRRTYYYLIVAGALLTTTGILQNLIHELVLRIGLTDYVVYPGSEFPGPDPVNLTRALTFLLVDLIIVVPVGGLHYFLLRRDMRQEPLARGGVVRAIFLALLALGTGLTVLFASIAVVSSLGSNTASQSAVAVPLSAALAWAVAFGAILLEWRSSEPFREEGTIIAAVFALLGQWVVLIAGVVLVSLAIQAYLQQVISPLPSCGPDAFDGCIYASQPLGATLAALLAIGGCIAIIFWKSRWMNAGLRLADTIVGTAIGGVTITIFLVIAARYVLDLAAGVPGVLFPQSLVTSSTIDGINGPTYVFVGPLVAGLVVLGYYVLRLGRQPESEGILGRQNAVATLALPLALVFFIGASLVLGNIFLVIGGRVLARSDWNTAWMFLLAGIPWLALWPTLAAMSRSTSGGPQLPRRVYTYILLSGTVGAAVISLLVALAIILSGLLQAALDPSGDGALRGLGTALATGAGVAYYVFVVIRDGRILHQQAAAAPAPAPPPPVAPPSLEGLLSQVAERQVSIEQAATFLRQHPEIR